MIVLVDKGLFRVTLLGSFIPVQGLQPHLISLFSQREGASLSRDENPRVGACMYMQCSALGTFCAHRIGEKTKKKGVSPTNKLVVFLAAESYYGGE